MTNSMPIFKIVRFARRHWLSGIALLLSILIWSKGLPAWAAPLNQTVPQPTATKAPTPVPQATNTPHEEHHGNNNTPAPTSTPAPQQPTATAQQQPAPASGLTGVVSAERLNVRQGPGTDFGVIGTVLNGQTVNVLNRNATGDWWHICCINGTQNPGWVNAKFIQPNFDAAQANNLIPLAGNETAAPAIATSAPATATSAPATQVVTPTATTEVAATQVTTNTVSAAQAVTSTVAAETTPAAEGLQLTLEQTPTLVWQGHSLELHFTITNTTNANATKVELRDELQQELKFISAEAGNGGKIVLQNGVGGRYVVDMQWPTLAAGATVTATVKLQIAANTPNGAVIDNLAVAAAANLTSNTAGVSIGLPPSGPPDFQ